MTPEPSNNDARSEYLDKLNQEVAKLHAYREAIAQEFADADPDDPETARKARLKVIELVPDAGTTLSWLINHAESESVRASLSKFVFQEAMKFAHKDGEESALDKLIKELQGAKSE